MSQKILIKVGSKSVIFPKIYGSGFRTPSFIYKMCANQVIMSRRSKRVTEFRARAPSCPSMVHNESPLYKGVGFPPSKDPLEGSPCSTISNHFIRYTMTLKKS